MPEKRFLLVHGVGYKEADGSWDADWQQAIKQGFAAIGAEVEPTFDKVPYDDLFRDAGLDAATVAEALARLLASGVYHGIDDLLRRRGLLDRVRWTAGMVAQWAADEGLRERCRQQMLASIQESKPEVICAHSLGSLIAYDTFARHPQAARGRTLVSFGSQIGNPFIRSIFGGRLEPLASGGFWYHLFNTEDAVLTAEVRIAADNFAQVDTFFDIAGITDHDPAAYLSHPNTLDRVWRPLAEKVPGTRSRAVAAVRSAKPQPKRRALLVGINDYPNPADRLDGCVNDVFLMSEVLQELGFEAEDIRVVLNERATAAGIRERLTWLLEGAGADDYRFLFYSGHGAQIPGYGGRGEVDAIDESLVPYDFDWSPERAVTDDWFCELYSQLPYEAQFIAVLDCCHSGGMTRNGAQKVRGLTPSDDIRHRSLRWDKTRGMWIPRDLQLASRHLLDSDARRSEFLGSSGAIKRLGRAVPTWTSARRYREATDAYGHIGPYLPILLEACQEGEYAYEYRHGATSFGAFTYSLVNIFRQAARSGKGLSWEVLMRRVAKRLKELEYQQTPVLVCPRAKKNELVPR